ncbi:MAG: PA2928 family protein, partial [Spirochaetota bacterium]
MRRTFSILTAVILAAIVTSCLHKDVSSGTADDVICTYIVHRDGKAALVNLETVFQASSKQYNGGMRITGYEDFRITVIRIDTGEITARKKVGKRFVHVIALSGEDIWLYNRKQGLYSLDLITLELSHTRDDISKANPSLSDTLVQPEWNEAAKYYGYDPATERIIITDTQGVRYQLDPVSLEVSPHTGEFTQASVSPYDDYFDGSIRYPSGTLSLEGGLRKTISFNGQTVAGSDAFIEGSFIVFEHERISLENAEKTGRRNQSDTDRARHLKNTVKILTELVNDPATPSPIVEKSLEILQGLTDQLETLEESIQEKTAGTDLPEAVYIAHKESLS